MFKKLLLPIAILGSSVAMADTYDVYDYLQISLGSVKAEQPTLARVLKNDNHFSGSDRTDGGVKIALGMKFNPYIGVEAQYVDLGESTYSFREIGYAAERMKLKSHGFGVNIVGMVPLERFSFFTKTGIHLMSTKYSFTGESSKNSRKFIPSIGFGASYDLTYELSIVAEYERYFGAGDNLKIKNAYSPLDRTNIKHDIDFASLGLRYVF